MEFWPGWFVEDRHFGFGAAWIWELISRAGVEDRYDNLLSHLGGNHVVL